MTFLCAAQEAQQNVPSFSQSNVKRTKGPGAPGAKEYIIRAVVQDFKPPLYHLEGSVLIETNEILLRCDVADYNEDTGNVDARGHVFYHRFDSGEELTANRVEYNVTGETGKFYDVQGWAKPRITARPRTLTSTSPFYFQGKWAERIENRYILHDGFITGCRMPKPWWTLNGPKFLIIPNEHAIAYKSIFRLRRFPLFYAPAFYKSLEKEPRQSGFLTPNIGNSSIKGRVLGAGYYWAPNRSYDAAYRGEYFSSRGFAHQVGIRGRPAEKTEFSFFFFAVNDNKGQGGFLIESTGKSDLGHGFQAVGDLHYLTSLLFRQTFTESFNEAIFAEVHSSGYITKHWSDFDVDLVASRLENFQSSQPHDEVVIRKLPEVHLDEREHQFWSRLPFWVSFDSSMGLERRDQLLFQTRQFMSRMDLEPKATAALRWKGLNLIPSFALRGTHWGEQRDPVTGHISGQDINRGAREISLELAPPALARTFVPPKWLGDKVKHVIEPRANFLYITGIGDFDRLIRLDETEVLANTQQVEFSLTNRLYVKRNGQVSELATWELYEQRYFDPTFGGVVVPGQRNVTLNALELTPFAFVDQPRHQSPIVSVLRLNPLPGYGFEWRSDYDPVRGRFTNGGLNADFRHTIYYFSVQQTFISSIPVLSPSQNQIRAGFNIGSETRRGWNAGFSTVYDYRLGALQYTVAQTTYNTDCCGLSVQFRRFNFGTRNETQFRVAFAIANIGSFGTLKKQETLF